jgi:hypothetical protein
VTFESGVTAAVAVAMLSLRLSADDMRVGVEMAIGRINSRYG